jgi:hypothetical protein
MGIVFQLILVSGVIKYSCKATFFKGYKGIIIYALFSGIIAIACYPFIIKTDSDVFNTLMTDTALISNIAVLITIEAISGIFISIGMLNNLFESKLHKWIRVLKLMPGVIIIGIIFYMELSLFRTLIGIAFYRIAIVAALLCMLGIIMLSSLIKYLLPHFSTRYELKFLINILLLISAVLLNAGLADYNTGSYTVNIEYTKLLVLAGIVITGFLSGLLLYKNKRIINKIYKNK